ncbi:MAG: peptide deformylase [Deltaproteobacteria bacterium]|nr:MAG: peptide deformylase [Deltaproteobacteria bacterium]
MAILPILTYPDPVLTQRAEPVEEVTEDLVELSKNMLETMYAAPGIGLAAPQIGVSKRLIVVDIGEEHRHPIVLLNPEITHREGKIVYTEGCLSLPGIVDEVTRAQRVVVKGLDIEGKSEEIDAQELLAVCLQHEIDHLDGILFIDRLSSIKRTYYRRKLRKKQA